MSERTQRLVVERELWEYRFLGQLLTHEIESAAELREDLRLGRPSQGEAQLPAAEIARWVKEQNSLAVGLIETFERLVGVGLQDALGGPEGPHGEPEKIQSLAKDLGGVYREALEWEIRNRGARVVQVADEFISQELLALYSQQLRGVADTVEILKDKLDSVIAKIDSLEVSAIGEMQFQINVNVDLGWSDSERERLSELFDKLGGSAREYWQQRAAEMSPATI